MKELQVELLTSDAEVFVTASLVVELSLQLGEPLLPVQCMNLIAAERICISSIHSPDIEKGHL